MSSTIAGRGFDDVERINWTEEMKGISKESLRGTSADDAAVRHKLATMMVHDAIVVPSLRSAREVLQKCVSSLVPGDSVKSCEAHKTAISSRYESMMRWTIDDCKAYHDVLKYRIQTDSDVGVSEALGKMNVCLQSKEAFYLLRGAGKGTRYPVFTQETGRPADFVATKMDKMDRRDQSGWVQMDAKDEKTGNVDGRISKYSNLRLGVSVPSKWLETKGHLHDAPPSTSGGSHH